MSEDASLSYEEMKKLAEMVEVWENNSTISTKYEGCVGLVDNSPIYVRLQEYEGGSSEISVFAKGEQLLGQVFDVPEITDLVIAAHKSSEETWKRATGKTVKQLNHEKRMAALRKARELLGGK